MLFFVNGAIYGNWIPRLPEIKDRLGVSNAGLGVALIGGGIGGLIGSLAVGAIVARFGSRRVVLTTLLTLPAIMTLVAFVPQAWMLLVALSLIGLVDVCADVAMNAQGVIAQERLGRSIMNRLHGLWSLGFGTGTVVGSLGAGTGVDLRMQVVTMAVLLTIAVVFVAGRLERVDTDHRSESDSTSRRHLGVIAVMLAAAGAGAIALEGAPYEWAALLMRDDYGIGAWAGFGTVAFGVGMLVGRFAGDHALEWFGETRLYRGAIVLVVSGFAAAVAGVPWLAFVGLVVSGLGQAVLFPRLYLLAARVPGLSAASGLGALMVGLRIGGMATTLSMGAVSNAYDLRSAFVVVGIVAALTLLGANSVVSRRVRV